MIIGNANIKECLKSFRTMHPKKAIISIRSNTMTTILFQF